MHHDFNWFVWLGGNPRYVSIYSALFVGLILIGASLVYRWSLKPLEQEVVPSGKMGLKNLFQGLIEWVLGQMEGMIGHDAAKYFPLIGGVFIYVLVNNLLGAIPGFTPATGNVNTNLAIALTVFVYYNYLGIKQQGLKNYLKHFMGPVIWIAPFIMGIELFSHAIRPLTLTVRLYLNLTSDHIVLGIFSNLVPVWFVVVPIVFMAFGIFVSLVQAFVFMLLSIVYISMAVAHEEGGTVSPGTVSPGTASQH